MSLMESIAGAIPEQRVSPLGPRSPKDTRRYLPQHARRWSRARFAKLCGLHPNTLRVYLYQSAELQAMLGIKRWRGSISKTLTNEQAQEAAQLLLKLAGLTHAFSPRHELDACVSCGGTKSMHRGHGLCRACWHRQERVRQGKGIYPHQGMWDRVRGLTACSLCERSDVPHRCDGMCNSCYMWTFRHKRDGVPDDVIKKAALRRRDMIRAGRNRRGRASIMPWELPETTG